MQNRYKSDIVIVGQQAWNVSIGSNCKDIALELSRHNRVLYVDSPLDRITSLRARKEIDITRQKEVIRKKSDGLREIKDGLWTLSPDVMIESINWINSGSIFDYLNKRNNRLFANSIKKALKRLDFTNFILFNDNDIFKSFYLKEFLEPRISVYYSRDFMLGVDYWRKHGERLEPMLIGKSDVCVANSAYLSNYCKQYNPNSFDIGQGCNLEGFHKSNLKAAQEIAGMNGPKVGYVGALQSIRLDVQLISYLATSRPDWNIILVGPQDDVFKNSNLHSLPNIYFLGSKTQDSLPNYINSFDVCINPQLINSVTIGNYPRKIDEYLALGKPVVAVRTEALSIFENFIYVADNKEEFVKLVEAALIDNQKEFSNQRIQLARSHSWENSVLKLYDAIESVNKS